MAAVVPVPNGPLTDIEADRTFSVLRSIESRVLWLSTAMIDHANRVRPNPSGMKVGGHQASSASMVTIMTALWMNHLRSADRVSVKPHAGPVLHALNYLLGELAESYLTTLREFGGLQSYPSRTKDPDRVDYSTGSVGIGGTSAIWGALARRYLTGRFSRPVGASGRQYSLVGDAELDEGACWEAIVDPMVSEMGELVWIVDVNRQSLDRVIPNIAASRLRSMFAAAGWQVITAKYGSLLEEIFERRDGGSALRDRLDAMTNPEYQRLLRCAPAELRKRLPGSKANARAIAALIDSLDDRTLWTAFRNLGGHDLPALDRAFNTIDDGRPTVIFAYTLKGYRLPTEGHPQNHSALLTAEQLAELSRHLGTSTAEPWQRFGPESPEGLVCAATADRLRWPSFEPAAPPTVPDDLGRRRSGSRTTQAALGRTLLELNRVAPEVGERIVTVSPDVTSSTNLAGWVNKVGVWSPEERPDWFADDPETALRWRERTSGRHIELGIAETNLVGAIAELGATWSRWGEPLLPIGVLYDPFVERALEPWRFGIYAGGQSILIGTPSGVSLAPEGGAHQSITTPSIGLEQPGCISYEPAFAIDTEWVLLAALSRLGQADGSSAYLRLSTRPIDQSLARLPVDPACRQRRRRNVVAGAYLLDRAASAPQVSICAMGALLPEALNASARLAKLGFPADVICLTSPDLIFRAIQARRGLTDGADWILQTAFPERRAAPMVTVLDGHPHTLAFLAGIHQVPGSHLGVSEFGQSGDLDSVYRYQAIDVDSIVATALDLVD